MATSGREYLVMVLQSVDCTASMLPARQKLLAAYRVLFEQWRLCFAIGRANAALGHAPTPLRELLREVFRFLRE